MTGSEFAAAIRTQPIADQLAMEAKLRAMVQASIDER
jgi:hypothetical protein